MLLSTLERRREELSGNDAHRPEPVLGVLRYLERVQQGGPLPPERLATQRADGQKKTSSEKKQAWEPGTCGEGARAGKPRAAPGFGYPDTARVFVTGAARCTDSKLGRPAHSRIASRAKVWTTEGALEYGSKRQRTSTSRDGLGSGARRSAVRMAAWVIPWPTRTGVPTRVPERSTEPPHVRPGYLENASTVLHGEAGHPPYIPHSSRRSAYYGTVDVPVSDPRLTRWSPWPPAYPRR